MLSKISMELIVSSDKEFNIYKSSLFHGALMELIQSDYAELMHLSAMKPFSQYLSKRDDKWMWTISALNDEAYEKIIKPLAEVDDIHLSHSDADIHIASRNIIRTSAESLFESNYYGEKKSRFVRFDIATPVSFKNEGRYVYYPDPLLILQNLIHRYDSFSDKTEIYEESLINEIAASVKLSDFNIRSTGFYLERVKIPSFTGRITLKVSGNQNLVSLVNLLADFAEFSGVGIKTALGMGAVSHVINNDKERIKKNERNQS